MFSVQKAGGGVVGVGTVVMEGLLSDSAMLWQQRGVSTLGVLAWSLWVVLLLGAPGGEELPCRAVLMIQMTKSFCPLLLSLSHLFLLKQQLKSSVWVRTPREVFACVF